jgi:hypothetical protein
MVLGGVVLSSVLLIRGKAAEVVSQRCQETGPYSMLHLKSRLLFNSKQYPMRYPRGTFLKAIDSLPN